jgi:hypothetical protein
MLRRTRAAQTAIKAKPPKDTIEAKLRKLVQSASIWDDTALESLTRWSL